MTDTYNLSKLFLAVFKYEHLWRPQFYFKHHFINLGVKWKHVY